jgi:hypothetical protein
MTGRAADPTPEVREGTYARDGRRCVSCGRRDQLSYQHRQSVGMGGSKIRPGYADGVTACMDCNPRFEHDLQTAALRFGWKVPRWVVSAGRVPVFDTVERQWYALDTVGGREPVTEHRALQLMHAVYGDDYQAAFSTPAPAPMVAPEPWRVA